MILGHLANLATLKTDLQGCRVQVAQALAQKQVIKKHFDSLHTQSTQVLCSIRSELSDVRRQWAQNLDSERTQFENVMNTVHVFSHKNELIRRRLTSAIASFLRNLLEWRSSVAAAPEVMDGIWSHSETLDAADVCAAMQVWSRPDLPLECRDPEYLDLLMKKAELVFNELLQSGSQSISRLADSLRRSQKEAIALAFRPLDLAGKPCSQCGSSVATCACPVGRYHGSNQPAPVRSYIPPMVTRPRSPLSPNRHRIEGIFHKRIAVPSAAGRRQPLDPIRRELASFHGSLLKAFESMDYNCSGKLCLSDLEAASMSLGFLKGEVRLLFRALDEHNRGYLTWAEFSNRNVQRLPSA
jgi:hypothetical protein